VRALTSFEGRLSRGRFWTGILVLAVFAVAVGGTANVLDWVLDLRLPRAGRLGLLTLLAATAVAYGFFALQTKRWHDRDKSGWWNLLVLVPAIGPVWIVVEAGMLQGTPGPNQFGPDPLV
jgi:uncharacterized membrane protein YhaH (DUF805 family)